MAQSSDLQTWLLEHKLSIPEINGALDECEIYTLLHLLIVGKEQFDVLCGKLKVIQRKKFINAVESTSKALEAIIPAAATAAPPIADIPVTVRADTEVQRQLDEAINIIATKDREITDLKLRLAIAETAKAVPAEVSKTPVKVLSVPVDEWECKMCKATNPMTGLAAGESRRCSCCFTTYPPAAAVPDGTALAPSKYMVRHRSSKLGGDEWQCRVCNIVNKLPTDGSDPDEHRCSSCNSLRRTSSSWRCLGCGVKNRGEEKTCKACSAERPIEPKLSARDKMKERLSSRRLERARAKSAEPVVADMKPKVMKLISPAGRVVRPGPYWDTEAEYVADTKSHGLAAAIRPPLPAAKDRSPYDRAIPAADTISARPYFLARKKDDSSEPVAGADDNGKREHHSHHRHHHIPSVAPLLSAHARTSRIDDSKWTCNKCGARNERSTNKNCSFCTLTSYR